MWSRVLRSEGGQSLIEMALVMPILIFTLMGMATFGVAINSKIAVSGAAREAARAYAITHSVAEAQAKATAFLKGSIPASDTEFTGSFNPSSDVLVQTNGDYVTVTVTYHQTVYVPGLTRLLDRNAADLGNKMPLQSSATFRIES